MKLARKSQLAGFAVRDALPVMEVFELLLNHLLPQVDSFQFARKVVFIFACLRNEMKEKEILRSSSMSGESAGK